jgi:hypothetical protein
MKKKYLFFNNPVTLLIIVVAIIVLMIGIHILSGLWRGNDFAVSFFIACVSIILVNMVIATEGKQSDKDNQ